MAELKHLSDHAIDVLVAQDRVVDAHLEGCAECQARLLAARGAAQAFLARNPPVLSAEKLLATRGRRWFSWPAASMATAAALVVLVLVLAKPTAEPILDKGGPDLSFSVERGGVSRPGIDGEVLAPGDGLRLRLIPAHFRRAVVTVVDGRGRSTRLVDRRVDGPIVLQELLVLDADPEAERVVVEYSDAPDRPGSVARSITIQKQAARNETSTAAGPKR